MRCNLLETGKRPKKPKHHEGPKFVAWLVKMLIAGAAACGLAYVLVLHQGQGTPTKQSCSINGQALDGAPPISYAAVQPPGDFTVDSTTELEGTDLASEFVNQADNSNQRQSDLTNGTGALDEASMQHSIKIVARSSTDSLDSILIEFPSTACATDYVSSLNSQMSKAAKRLHGTKDDVSQPGGSKAYTFNGDGVRDTTRIVFVKGAYVSFIESTSLEVAKSMASSQANYLPSS